MMDGGFMVILRDLLSERDITQKQLAYAIGCDETKISGFVHSKRFPLDDRINFIRKIADFFNMEVEDFCDYDYLKNEVEINYEKWKQKNAYYEKLHSKIQVYNLFFSWKRKNIISEDDYNCILEEIRKCLDSNNMISQSDYTHLKEIAFFDFKKNKKDMSCSLMDQFKVFRNINDIELKDINEILSVNFSIYYLKRYSSQKSTSTEKMNAELYIKICILMGVRVKDTRY